MCLESRLMVEAYVFAEKRVQKVAMYFPQHLPEDEVDGMVVAWI